MKETKRWKLLVILAGLSLGIGLTGLGCNEPFVQTADPSVVQIRGVELELVWIEGGTFQMGCSPGDTECAEIEKPQHQVEISGFWMGKYEVTQAQWKAVMGSNPAYFTDCGNDCPIERVSWDDTRQFLRRARNNLRLPTEAEWEYAARGGVAAPRHGPLNLIAWHLRSKRSSGLGTNPVGKKLPNGYGLYDMLGNVSEWTADRYQRYTSGLLRNPAGFNTPSGKVFRGGSWNTDGRDCRASARKFNTPDTRYRSLGFRVVRDEGQ